MQLNENMSMATYSRLHFWQSMFVCPSCGKYEPKPVQSCSMCGANIDIVKNYLSDAEQGALCELDNLFHVLEPRRDLNMVPDQKLHAYSIFFNIKNRHVQCLSVHGKWFTDLPAYLSAFVWVEELRLNENKISTLPEYFGTFEKLKKLILRLTNLQSLPGALFNCTQLEELDISGTPIQSLPSEFNRLQNLKILNLKECSQLQGLPEDIVHLPRLRALWLDRTKFAPPEALFMMDSLEILSIAHFSAAQYAKISDKLSNLKNLKWLDIEKAQISEIPASIFKIPNLETLIMAGCNFTHLPEQLGDLTKLKGLMANNVPLQSTPKSLGKLSQLESLVLHLPGQKTLPEEIRSLKNLKTLNFTGDILEKVPAWISELQKLEDLFLFGPVKSLPKEILEIPSLKRIDLTNAVKAKHAKLLEAAKKKGIFIG